MITGCIECKDDLHTVTKGLHHENADRVCGDWKTQANSQSIANKDNGITIAVRDAPMNITDMPKKYQLLDEYHPTVLRRLCKELNFRPAGFYHNGERYNQARFSKGVLQIRMGGDQWTTVEPMALSIYGLGDGNGGTITASRTRCGS